MTEQDKLIGAGGFNANEIAALGVIAGLMIPASEEYGVPAASDPDILARICQLLSGERDLFVTLLAEVTPAMTAAEAEALMARAGPAGALLTSAAGQAYYQDDRVLQSLGLPPGPPFPQGYETPQGDWSLLDPVRQMAKRYRDA